MTQDHAKEQAEAQYNSILELLEADDADEITDNALEVTVRSDWVPPYANTILTAAEFMILLCTGGPAVRIIGELDEHCQPCKARIEYQDWGTQWTTWHPADNDVLVDYASYFYFGE